MKKVSRVLSSVLIFFTAQSALAATARPIKINCTSPQMMAGARASVEGYIIEIGKIETGASRVKGEVAVVSGRKVIKKIAVQGVYDAKMKYANLLFDRNNAVDSVYVSLIDTQAEANSYLSTNDGKMQPLVCDVK